MSLAALGLIASACGSSTDDGLAADADSAGVARSFCDSVADLGANIQTGSPAPDQAAAAAATMELIPSDAPEFATSYFQAIADATQLQATGADSSIAEAAWANGQHLQVSAFLGATCPDSEFTSSASFQGMIAMGMDMQAAGVATDAGETATPTTIASGTSDDAATDTTPAPAPTVEPGLNRVVLGEGSASGLYAQVEWTVGEITSTNADAYDWLTSDAEVGDNEFWLIVGVNGETQSNIRTNYDQDDFFLTSPDGLTMNGEELIDSFGENLFQLEFDGQENKSGFIVFATPEQITSLDGWSISVKVGDQIPLVLPLVGEAPALETVLVLDPPATLGVRGDSIWEGCEITYDLDVLTAEVTIDSSHDNKIHRARVGERYLVVTYDITSTTENVGSSPCTSSAERGFDPEFFRLSIDGRVSTPEALETEEINEGATVAGQAVYLLPAEATELTLLGETFEEVYNTWQVDIWALPGE